MSMDTYLWQTLPLHVQLRCFIGLWPEPSALGHLERLAAQAQGKYGGRAMLAEHMHLTLAFMGASPVGRLKQLLPALQTISWEPLALRLNRVGLFEQAAVLWLGPDAAQSDALKQLRERHEFLWQLLQERGWKRTERDFIPHVSLLRHCQAVTIESEQVEPEVPIYCRQAYLIASVPTHQGSQYRVLCQLGTAVNVV